MGTRRILWVWGGVGALFLLLLAGWVFRASLVEQRKPRSSFGANPAGVATAGSNPFPHAVGPNAASANPSLDPRLQETLRTINEINRINKINQELRANSAAKPGKPPSPSPSPASGRGKSQK